MHFKKLELVGFKSFADKTAIEFPPGVTAIVGPNGCGKSNVADAMRWVLGEQSVKSLRGADMQDVIFSGSSAKEPLNFAEVSLTLSNESRILPIEYEEVTISRRLYRSGESEYLLNQNTVRLKDIQELLMGTGIGTDSYSIIEQGRMDAVLAAKPEDRREIFEEAAGITKYKSKKKEALRKLEQTDANLLRVNDIIQEVKRQIGSVERQAKKAESYKKELEKMKRLELWAAAREFSIFEGQKNSEEEKLGALKEEEAGWASVMEELQSKCHAQKSALDTLENSLKVAALEEMTASTQARRHQDRVLLNRERIGELAAKKQNLLKAIESSSARSAALAAEAEKLAARLAEISADAQAQAQASALEAEESVHSGFESAVASLRSQMAQGDARVRQTALEIASLEREAAHRQAQRSGIQSRLKKISLERDVFLREIRDAEDALRGTLFDSAAGDEAIQNFEVRVRRFKDKIVEFLKRLSAERREALSVAEETQLDAEILTFTEDVSEAKIKTADSRARREHFTASKNKAEGRLATLESEARLLAQEEEGLFQKDRSAESEAARLSEERASIEVSLKRLGEELAGAQTEREKHLVSLTESRVKRAEYTQWKERLERDKRRAEDSRAEEDRLRVGYEAEIAESASRREALEKENESLEEAARVELLRRDEILKNTEGVKGRRQEAGHALAELEAELEAKRSALDELRRRIHDTEMEKARTGFEMDRLKERIFNAYQVDLAVRAGMQESEDDFLKELRGPDNSLDLDRVKETIRVQREKLNKMGPVNLVAIEEFDEMRERFDFLNRQEADLLKAKDDLHKAILKINRTTRELFSETFEKIKAHFGDYYRLLFGGGSADLVLLDEENVLESGIEIVARPPGKRLQGISLLSGGEKALTATALLFALFKVRPSPFCVLDEIDAPLDEANVERFCTVLREFINQSQFIAITHNKRTMNLADALYGITMAENGVSKVVSVKFQEKKTAELVS